MPAWFRRRREDSQDENSQDQESPDEHRREMVEQQLMRRGIRDPQVLRAMSKVPRETFVPAKLQSQAYRDGALAIACQQTISQPYVVAAMTEALDLASHHRVLEIGTGSGYQTAVLAEIAAQVTTVERHAPLLEAAAVRLAELGYANIEFHHADGRQGWPDQGPWDRIIVTAAGSQCPPLLWQQLAEGGVLVGPFGATGNQLLQRIVKTNGEPQTTNLFPVGFVPLVEGLGS